MINTRIKTWIVIASLAFLIIPHFSYGIGDFLQSSPDLSSNSGSNNLVRIATVNIYNAGIISQNQNNFKIEFDISNREGIQPGVKYAVQIIKRDEKAMAVIDEEVYSEMLDLEENSTIHREIEYTAPAFLNGDFELWVISKNDKSLPLGQGIAGRVGLNGNGQYIEIDQNLCYVEIDGNNGQKYSLNQGVDISKDEKIIVRCDLINHSSSDIAFVPFFETYFRSTFGANVTDTEEITQPALSIKADEKRNFYFVIPKAKSSQAYDSKLTMIKNGKAISNPVVIHYVIQGESGTIQNLVLDKDYYLKDDIAKISFYWTGSADTFPGSRNGNIDTNDILFNVKINDFEDNSCIDKKQSEISLKNSEGIGKYEFEKTIIINCRDPKIAVSLKNKSGSVLDDSEVKLKSSVSVPANQKVVSSKLIKMAFIIFAVLALVFIIAIVVIITFKKRRISVSFLILLISILIPFFLFGIREVKADTYYANPKLPDACATAAIFTISLDKATYASGEQIVATGSTSRVGSCNNGDQVAYLQVTVSGVQQWLACWDSYNSACYPGYFLSSKIFTAPALYGAYQASFSGAGYGMKCYACDPYCSQHGLDWAYPYNISYTVIGFTPELIALPDTGTVPPGVNSHLSTTVTGNDPGPFSYPVADKSCGGGVISNHNDSSAGTFDCAYNDQVSSTTKYTASIKVTSPTNSIGVTKTREITVGPCTDPTPSCTTQTGNCSASCGQVVTGSAECKLIDCYGNAVLPDPPLETCSGCTAPTTQCPPCEGAVWKETTP